MSSVGLTGKQKWRRQPQRLRNNHHNLFYREGLDDSPHFNQPHRAHSDQTISQPNNMMCRAWATTGDLNSISTIDSYDRSRRVKFNSAVHVILIPTVEEYRTAGLDEQMWWCDIDYKKFKESAVEELRRFLQENSRSDAKSALKLLYQPECKDSTSSLHETVQQCPSSSSRSSLKSTAVVPSALAPSISIDCGGYHVGTTTVSNHPKVPGLNSLPNNKENSSIISIKCQHTENLDSGTFTALPVAASSGTITKRSAVVKIAPTASNPAFAALAPVPLIC